MSGINCHVLDDVAAPVECVVDALGAPVLHYIVYNVPSRPYLVTGSDPRAAHGVEDSLGAHVEAAQVEIESKT